MLVMRRIGANVWTPSAPAASAGALAGRLGAARDAAAEAAFAGGPDEGVAVWRHPSPSHGPEAGA